MCRDRWVVSGGDTIAPVQHGADCWPDGREARLYDVEVGIALTVPEMAEQEPRHEIEALYVDLIARARNAFYAESQYFASRKVAEAIAKRLAEPDGPEFVIVHPIQRKAGWSRWRWIRPAPVWWRPCSSAIPTAACASITPYRRGQPIYVHAKVTVVDRDVLRVGSSNFNNRSLRLDTECDVVIDAERPANDDERATIAGIRNGLWPNIWIVRSR
jgi:phosphatidylserine/phosphatidylglycerophosphate/cardiolipin synthase-like enzyme